MQRSRCGNCAPVGSLAPGGGPLIPLPRSSFSAPSALRSRAALPSFTSSGVAVFIEGSPRCLLVTKISLTGCTRKHAATAPQEMRDFAGTTRIPPHRPSSPLALDQLLCFVDQIPHVKRLEQGGGDKPLKKLQRRSTNGLRAIRQLRR